MARLARYVDIGPAGRVGIGGEIVILVEIGGVAVGALGICSKSAAETLLEVVAGRLMPGHARVPRVR